MLFFIERKRAIGVDHKFVSSVGLCVCLSVRGVPCAKTNAVSGGEWGRSIDGCISRGRDHQGEGQFCGRM